MIWKMSTLNAFIESLTNEHEKLFQMGIIRNSKDQALFVGGIKVTNRKGKKSIQKTKFDYPNPKEKNQQSNEPSGSRKNKYKGKEGK